MLNKDYLFILRLFPEVKIDNVKLSIKRGTKKSPNEPSFNVKPLEYYQHLQNQL